jgi:HEAT repeat protein
MNEELTLAIEELRQRPTNISWFIPVLINNCDVPDRNIGAGETLRSLQWVKLYDNWNEGIRHILSVIQPNSAKVYELIQALANKSARVRINAANELGLLGGVADVAIPALIQALDDGNYTVCAVAAEALGKIGKATEQVIAKLLATIKRANPRYADLHAVHALAEFGKPGIHALIQATNFKDIQSLDEINKTLSSSGKPAIAPLLDALNSNSINIFALYSILSKIHDPNAIPELTEALHHKEALVRVAAAEALTSGMSKDFLRGGETNTKSVLSEVLSALIEGVHNSDKRIGRNAIEALSKIGDPASIRALKKAQNDQSEEIRSAATAALKQLGILNQ